MCQLGLRGEGEPPGCQKWANAPFRAVILICVPRPAGGLQGFLKQAKPDYLVRDIDQPLDGQIRKWH